MLKYLDKFLKKYKIRHQHITLHDNELGKVTMKVNSLYLIADYILDNYIEFEDAELDINNISNDESNIYIISPKSLTSFSNKKIELIKKRIKHEFKDNGFQLGDVVITSEERLRE
jgi:hypothetical protein